MGECDASFESHVPEAQILKAHLSTSAANGTQSRVRHVGITAHRAT